MRSQLRPKVIQGLAFQVYFYKPPSHFALHLFSFLIELAIYWAIVTLHYIHFGYFLTKASPLLLRVDISCFLIISILLMWKKELWFIVSFIHLKLQTSFSHIKYFPWFYFLFSQKVKHFDIILFDICWTALITYSIRIVSHTSVKYSQMITYAKALCIYMK